MDDLQLIEGLKVEDAACFRYLYKEYFPSVKRYVLKNSGDDDDAKDLFQDVLMTLIEKLKNGEYVHQNKFKSWIWGIVRNKWLNKLKELGKQEPLGPIDRGEEARVFEFPKMSLQKYLKQILEKLGEPCRSLLLATIVSKMKRDKVAEVFGYANAHSARQQKLQCLKKLRGLIDPDLLMDLI